MTDSPKLDSILESFERNARLVTELAQFDRSIVEISLQALRSLESRLREKGIDNPRFLVSNTIMGLENIQQNDSLRPKYEHMFNQCVVLLVSYFASSLGDVFRELVRSGLQNGVSSRLGAETIKVSFDDLHASGGNLADRAADLLLSQNKDIKFQDMQSTVRTLSKYFQIAIDRDDAMNDVILGQASRHALVHSDGIVDQHMAHQIANANPRRIKQSIEVGEPLQFRPAEVDILAESMLKLLRRIVSEATAIGLASAPRDSSIA